MQSNYNNREQITGFLGMREEVESSEEQQKQTGEWDYKEIQENFGDNIQYLDYGFDFTYVSKLPNYTV